MSRLTVQSVEGRRDARVFNDLPYRLYRRDQNWVAPLRSEEAARWDPRRNPALQSRNAMRFLALRDGKPVGRIATTVDPEFAERWAPRSGFFGFFECARDPEAARGLLHAAEGWLREQDARLVLGPVHLSFHNEVGLLAPGPPSSPMILSPYNPDYYADLIQGAGYAPRTSYHAYLWTPASRHSPAVDRILASARTGGARIRCLDRSLGDEEYRALFALYNSAFAGVFGFVPISWDEFRSMAKSFEAFAQPDLIFIAEAEGTPVGFSLTLPNVNEALLGLHGRLLPLGWLRLLRRIPRIRTARYILLGVDPEWIARGIAVRLARATVEAALRHGYERVELSLVHGDNSRVRHVIEAFGCPPIKTYVLYERTIA